MSKKLWAEAVNTVVYTINRTGSTSQEEKTPYELWFSKTPNINHLKTFGSEVYAHIPKEKRRKWDQKGRKGIFVGYSEETKGYRICFDGREVSLSRDVIFKETTELEIEINRQEEDTNPKLVAKDEENNCDKEENKKGEQNVDEENRSDSGNSRNTTKRQTKYPKTIEI